MANTGPVLVPQVTTTHMPPVPLPPPGAKPSTVVKAQPVALPQTNMVDKSTQTSKPRRLILSERVKQGIAALGAKLAGVGEKAVQKVPVQETPAERTPAEKPADEPAAKKSENTSETTSKTTSETTSETKEQPITVVHKPGLSERVIEKLKVVGSYLVAPLKLIFSTVKLVTKPLQDYVITPAYKGFLYVFQPARYNAIKLEQKAAAEKAEHDHQQAKHQAFEKACLAEAMQRHNKTQADLSGLQIARQFGVTSQEVADEVARHKARAEANFLFNKQLKAGNLELKKEKVLRTNPKTGEQFYSTSTRALTIANETNRAAVVVTEKTPDGKTVEKFLDADSAEVAMRLGNAPALANALNDYNKGLEAYKQKLAAFIKEDAKYQQAKEKAAKKDKPFDQQAPVHPGEPPRRPVLKCTDENVIAAFKLDSKQYRTNLETKVTTLINEVAALKADFVAAYPDNEDVKHFIKDSSDPEVYKAQVQSWAKKLEARLEDLREALKQEEESGNKHAVQTLSENISRMQKDIDINKRHLTIYAKECQKIRVQGELEYLNRMSPDVQKNRENDFDDWKNGAYVHDPESSDYGKRLSGTRDKLEIERLKEWVYKDAKGNDLDIFIKDAYGTKIGIDQLTYALVNDIIIPAPDKKLTPAHNGKTSDLDYRHQQGMKWSKASQGERTYQGYVAQRDENGKVLKDSDGNIKWEQAPGQLSNHWVVKPSDINGRHEGYDKFRTVVKNRASAEAPVVPAPRTAIKKIEKETRETIASMKAQQVARGAKPHALTVENLDTYNRLLEEAKNRKHRPLSADGKLEFVSDDSSTDDDFVSDDSSTDDDKVAMPKNLFEREEKLLELRESRKDLQQQMRTQAAKDIKKAESDNGSVSDRSVHSGDDSGTAVRGSLIEPVQGSMSKFQESLSQLNRSVDEGKRVIKAHHT